MNEPDDTPRTSISKARSLEEIADFWDTHSLADYWDQTHEVTFEVRCKETPCNDDVEAIRAYDAAKTSGDEVLPLEQALDVHFVSPVPVILSG